MNYSLDHDTASLTSSFKQLAKSTEVYGEVNKFIHNDKEKGEPEQEPRSNSLAYLIGSRPITAPIGFSPHAYSESSHLSASLNNLNLLPTYKDSLGNYYIMQPSGMMIALTPVLNQGAQFDGKHTDFTQSSSQGFASTGPVPPLQSVIRPMYAKSKPIVKRHSSFQHLRPLTSRQSSQRKLRDSHAQLLDVLQFNGLVDHSASSRYGDLDTATSVLNSATSSARNSLRSSARASSRSDCSPMGSESFREMKPTLLPP